MAADLIRRSVLALLGAAVLAACAAAPGVNAGPERAAGASEVIRVFLVRHGEKEVGSDPVLTAAGAARAVALAARLGEEGVTEIWSTRTNRTQQTAAPLAARLGIPVKTYDAGALGGFAAALTQTTGVKLVVGHSNTTDRLAALLGADPGPAIAEATEFDRLYVLSIEPDGIVRSRIERYGAVSPVESAPAE